MTIRTLHPLSDESSRRVAAPTEDGQGEPTAPRLPGGVDRTYAPMPKDILSESQLAGLVADGLEALKAADVRLTVARMDYERATARGAFRTDEAHQASFAENAHLVEEAEQAVKRAAEALQDSAGKVRRQVDATEKSNITAEEIQLANAQATFIKEDFADKHVSALVRDARRALAENDRPRMYLISRYAKRRLAQSLPGDRSHPVETGDLNALIAQIDRRFVDSSLERYRAQANAALDKLGASLSRATERQRALDQAKPAFDSAGRPLVKWPNR